jgi:multiple sugar transport system permease protein
VRRFLGARIDRLSDGRFALLTSVPGLLLVGLLIAPPILAVIAMSFFRIEFKSDSYTPFVGLRNFAVRLPADGEFLGSLVVSVAFALVTALIAVPLALATALFIKSRRRLRGVLGFLLLLPWAVAPISNGVYWRILFAPDSGVLNGALKSVGLPQVFISTAPGAFIAMALAVSWRALPLLGVLFLGALRQVPPEIEQAARLDGATRLQILRRVTLPAVAPTFVAACLIQFILSVQTFDTQYSMSNDAPPAGALLAGLAIYHRVIDNLALGYGAATTMVLGIVIAVSLYALFALVLRPILAPRPSPPVDEDPLAGRRRETRIGRAGAPEARALGSERTAPQRTAPAALARPLTFIRRTALVALAVLLVAFLAGPILWILVASVEPESALHTFPPALVVPPRLDAFTIVMGTEQWREAASVSVIVAVGGTVVATVAALFIGYPLARARFAAVRPVSFGLLATQLIPPIALVIPVVLVVDRLGIRNPILALILTDAAFWIPILVWLLAGAFAAVPEAIERAARLDGASRIEAIVRIAVPVAAPAIAAAVAIVFIGIWNDFIFVVVLGGNDTHTLVEVNAQSTQPPTRILAARMVLAAAPCLALVALFYRRVLRSL